MGWVRKRYLWCSSFIPPWWMYYSTVCKWCCCCITLDLGGSSTPSWLLLWFIALLHLHDYQFAHLSFSGPFRGDIDCNELCALIIFWLASMIVQCYFLRVILAIVEYSSNCWGQRISLIPFKQLLLASFRYISEVCTSYFSSFANIFTCFVSFYTIILSFSHHFKTSTAT